MHSLSARLLVLTVFFVMLTEVFIFVPSVAKFRVDWLGARMNAAHLAMLAFDAAPDRAVGEMLKSELLSQIGAHNVMVRRGGARLVLDGAAPPHIDATFNLADQGPWEMVYDALDVYFQADNRVIRVLSPSPADKAIQIELVLDEAPMRADMLGFGGRILMLSVVISLVTATLVYFSLHWMLVRPMRRITESMTAFSEKPEDARRIIRPSKRTDEIGTAERQLAAMQHGLRAALTQKDHLAALGTAVAKINHDLRGALSSALLVSDSLEGSDDPEVRKLAPVVINSIERAVALCSQTLDYAGGAEKEVKRQRFQLHPLVAEIKMAMEAPEESPVVFENRTLDAFLIDGDRDQVHRILGNLCRNAAESGATGITVSGKPASNGVEIDIRDNGPGLPPRALEKLFQPFEGSARAGGTGLGLAIARELAQGHGGDLTLVSSDASGTLFRLSLPLDTDIHSVVSLADSGGGE
ncbi:MAG: HAMP domain-containing histidine kinase [Proteobacteria bacterium]|nr:HAMP domain-containing histidine kinase [Pseudomonadota bacterium]MCK4866810.1 HAMP domain-containing histidine kinase [Alphaproteobacteria bacterium]